MILKNIWKTKRH